MVGRLGWRHSSCLLGSPGILRMVGGSAEWRSRVGYVAGGSAATTTVCTAQDRYSTEKDTVISQTETSVKENSPVSQHQIR